MRYDYGLWDQKDIPFMAEDWSADKIIYRWITRRILKRSVWILVLDFSYLIVITLKKNVKKEQFQTKNRNFDNRLDNLLMSSGKEITIVKKLN